MGIERALRAHDNPAYEEYRKGLELIYRQLWDTLAQNGSGAHQPPEDVRSEFSPGDRARGNARAIPTAPVVEVLQEGLFVSRTRVAAQHCPRRCCIRTGHRRNKSALPSDVTRPQNNRRDMAGIDRERFSELGTACVQPSAITTKF